MFFTHINQIMTPSVNLTLVIHKSPEGKLTVSIFPRADGLKDEAKNHIVPLTLSGMPDELDAGFMQAIYQPIQKTTGLLINLSQFEQAAANAAANSKAAKEKITNESKEAKEKRENYEKFMKRAEELISQQKHSEALINLRQAVLHVPEKDKKMLNDKINEVKMQLAQGSLFDLNQTTVIQPVPTIQAQSVIQTPSVPPSSPFSASLNIPQQPEHEPLIPIAQNSYNPDFCRPEEYAQYIDFPGYGNSHI